MDDYLGIGNRRSDFYFSDEQMQFNHDIRIWVCGAEITTHLRGTVNLRRGDRNGPSTFNFELDNVHNIFVITPENKGYLENEDGTFQYNDNAKVTPLDDRLSDTAKKKIDSIYDEIDALELQQQKIEEDRQKAFRNIEEGKNANGSKRTLGKTNEEEVKIKQNLKDAVYRDYENKTNEINNKLKVAHSRLGNLRRTTDTNGNPSYGQAGDFGTGNSQTYTNKSIKKTVKSKNKKEKLISTELIFNKDVSLYNDDLYNDAAKKLIYTNKTILNANIAFGNFIKADGTGFKPYDLNIDTPIIEKHDPIRVFIKDPSKPFINKDGSTTEEENWIPFFTGFVDSVTEHDDYLNGDSYLSVSCYDIRGMMQRMRVMTNPRISRGTDTARERAEAKKEFSTINVGYFNDFFAQSGLGGEKSTKYLHFAFDQVCLEFLTGRWTYYDKFIHDYLGKVVSSQSNEILQNTKLIEDINKNNPDIKNTRPSLNGIGTFIPGMIIECPNYAKDPDYCKVVMELWYDILVFGVKGTYYTADEIQEIGCATLPYGEFDSYNCFVHMITPPGGTATKGLFDSQLEDLQTGFDYHSRFEFLTQLCERLDYQWFTNSMGDIVIEFPMYDFEPDVFGAYADQLKVNKHLASVSLNEVADTVYSAVSASGGIQSIVGGVQAPTQFVFSAFAKSDQLAFKYGININEYSAPNLKTNTDSSRLRKQAIIELIKSNVAVSSMEMEVMYRHAIFPNKPILCVPKHRMATVTGFSYSYQINESVNCTIDTAMVKKMTERGYINIYNGTNLPVKYATTGDIIESDASDLGIDSFYIVDGKPTKDAKQSNSKK